MNAPVTFVPFEKLGHVINWKHGDTVRHYLKLAVKQLPGPAISTVDLRTATDVEQP